MPKTQAGDLEPGRRSRVVVCGTDFGRVYLAAIARTTAPLDLVGVLARGGERSQACAREYGVPLYTDVDQLPSDVDIACVVVGAGINGGPGAELAIRLMERGIHVLQEHPVHAAELADCLRAARRHGVVYRLNTLYPQVTPVRRFLAAGTALLRTQRPLFIDAVCAVQVSYSLFDILERLLGGIRPWHLDEPSPAEATAQFRGLSGTVGGVPFTLRVQYQLDPVEPDNHAHLLHRISLGTEGGVLSLVHTHGPLIWAPRLHRPATADDGTDIAGVPGAALDLPSALPLGPPTAPTHRQVIGELWPDAVARELDDVRTAALGEDDTAARGRRQLAVCSLWSGANGLLGAPGIVRHDQPEPVDPAMLAAAVAAVGVAG